ncbi:MAG: RNA 2',3'-cyclic phosphodiesterase [Alphaproteobacteria bacterium]|nr:RNA 2',3'-cyclic phosphodiesterase [Alphaproteobacteria bacterium]
MIRLFVAIPLPEAVRSQLMSLCAGVRGARWSPQENMHLTLRFIGEVEEPELADIAGALSMVGGSAFPLVLKGVGQFGDRRRARVLWAGVAASEALLRLQRRTESQLQRAGIAPEGRRYSPHVTLARLNNVGLDRVAPFLVEHGRFETLPFEVDRFVLYSSHLGQAGAIHTPEAEYPLEAAAD